MGKLRQIGRKIKKGVKKLFGSKFGKILGGIGLAMMFFGGANALFGNQKWFQGLKTNLNKVNPFAKGDVTGAVESATQALDTTASVTTTPSVGTNEFLEGAKASAKGGIDLAKQTQTKAYSPEFLTETSFADLDTLGQKIKKVGVETKDFLLPEGSMDTFVPDVAKSVLGTVAVGKIMEEEEQTAGFGRLPSVGSMEAPQSAYVAEVRNQMPNLPATNFNQLNQSLFYGTLSPQYLMGQIG
jgi:hypothetical protein